MPRATRACWKPPALYLSAAGPAPLAVDLGSGTGSTLRAFGREGDTRWRLVDHDPRLLEAAGARLEGFAEVEKVEADLGRLSPDVVAGARLVTASALFDLALAPWWTRSPRCWPPAGSVSNAALNYDGDMRWEPPLALDATVLDAFNAHQRGDKGLGPALGPEAADALRRAFETRGYTVRVAPSPGGWMTTKRRCETPCSRASSARSRKRAVDRRTRRLGAGAKGRPGTCHVGHWDVLALPPGE